MDKRILALHEKMYKDRVPLTFMNNPVDSALQRHNEFERRLALIGYRVMELMTIKYNKERRACEEASRALEAHDWHVFASIISGFVNELSFEDHIYEERIFGLNLITGIMRDYMRLYDEQCRTCSSGIELATRMYEAESHKDALLRNLNEEFASA